MDSDRSVINAMEAISKQYNLLFGHSQSLRKEAQLFLETFSASDSNEDPQTYLFKAQDSAQICAEQCDNATQAAQNIDVLLGKVNQSVSTINSKLKRITVADENEVDDNILNQMDEYLAAIVEKQNQFVEHVAQQKINLATTYNSAQKQT